MNVGLIQLLNVMILLDSKALISISYLPDNSTVRLYLFILHKHLLIFNLNNEAAVYKIRNAISLI